MTQINMFEYRDHYKQINIGWIISKTTYILTPTTHNSAARQQRVQRNYTKAPRSTMSAI